MEKNTEQLDRRMTPAEQDALECPPSQPMTPQQAAGILRSANLGGVLRAAADMGAEALERQVTQKELDSSRREGCEYWEQELADKLTDITGIVYVKVKNKFCPICGRPLTEDARLELVGRIGGNDGTTDNE